jgi:hypothetical protein
MKFRYTSFFLLLLYSVSAHSQDNQTDFSLFLKENLEFTALKPFFCLIRQEYVVIDEYGKQKLRGGNDFYGKAYTIGVLADDARLWFPTYVRFPWEFDNTLDSRTKKSSKPECSFINFKSLADKEYFKSKIQEMDERKLLTSILAGKYGIVREDSLQNNGTLIVFYSSAASPDDFTGISHSIMFLEDLNWNSDGVAEIEDLHYGNDKIIGGALFSRYLRPGSITWKLSGFYLPVKNKWVLKSIIKQ